MSFVSRHDIVSEMPARVSDADPRDFLALLKPRVMSLVIFTALAGWLIAPGQTHPFIAFVSLLAIAVGAGASGALNMWYDADIDAKMSRTRTRPIPAGRVTPEEALGFGLTLSAFSVVTLALVANWLAASLLAFTIFFYAVVYTMWLKRSTPQNIVIGGAAGALPPIVAYAAACNSVSLSSIVLFAIIFIWTPPHFWALALVKSADYARAGVPMMPNVKGPDRTRLEILLYTIVLAPVGVLPALMGFASPVYGVVAVAGGAGMLVFAAQVFGRREGEVADKAARKLFGFSILYLFALFAVIVVENSIAPVLRLLGQG
ncbi:MAG: protoheme farnesyltransferase [Hyphomicrobiales bacterium]|nr:protoheme farnesyltransferase [Hyphomicrobiales bacterium]